MKTVVIFILCVAIVTTLSGSAVCEPGVIASECTSSVCTEADECRCSSSRSPLSSDEVTPQLISLTFDEAVTEDFYNNFWAPLLVGRRNPDGEGIGATFFVPHEYTDYTKVNTLYSFGFEIGVNSITKNDLQEYWREASEQRLDLEFGGQKTIISKFANIPSGDIIGARTPQLQIAGNNSIQAYVSSGFQYDSSWPTLPSAPLYPYTLDYRSSQSCILGNLCPNEAFKGFWILPINELNGIGSPCNNLASCGVSGSADQISSWLLGEVNKIREGNREPLTLLVNTLFFDITLNGFEGFIKFLDALTEYNDVFLVSQSQVLDWSKHPLPLSQFRTKIPERSASCTPYTCSLKMESGQERNMNSCVSCPAVYPWLGNPEGN